MIKLKVDGFWHWVRSQVAGACDMHLVVSESRADALKLFGRIVHNAAVKVGSKTVVGRRIGVEKEVIRRITDGDAHIYERTLLLDLIKAVKEDVSQYDFDRLPGLLDVFKPKPAS